VSTAPVRLEDIGACLQGVIPSPFGTCSADGTPNVTYMSIVRYVDPERVALSRQFFNKSRANLDANPASQVWVVDPETGQEYVLDLTYLHTESEGPVFEAMRAGLEAVAAGGPGEGVFRLRGVDVHRVERCAAVHADPPAGGAARRPVADPLRALDELVRRLGACEDYGEATRVALEALDDLFGWSSAALLAAGEPGAPLFVVRGSGAAATPAGAEVDAQAGVVGVAAGRRRVVCVPSTARGQVMRAAVEAPPGGPAAGPGPASPRVASVAAAPLVVHGALLGVLYLESERAGTFSEREERLLRIVGGHLAATLAALEGDRGQSAPIASPAPPASSPATGGAATVTHYAADDTVMVDGDYVVRGVPGRLLWHMLVRHRDEGRTAFTNRELRLDEGLGLPAGNDNLEARLLVLRRRLEGGRRGITLERVGRGRLALGVARPLHLEEVPTRGPWRDRGNGGGA
jgi:hypothetical protein